MRVAGSKIGKPVCHDRASPREVLLHSLLQFLLQHRGLFPLTLSCYIRVHVPSIHPSSRHQPNHNLQSCLKSILFPLQTLITLSLTPVTLDPTLFQHSASSAFLLSTWLKYENMQISDMYLTRLISRFKTLLEESLKCKWLKSFIFLTGGTGDDVYILVGVAVDVSSHRC